MSDDITYDGDTLFYLDTGACLFWNDGEVPEETSSDFNFLHGAEMVH